jgi:hypothetical protein
MFPRVFDVDKNARQIGFLTFWAADNITRHGRIPKRVQAAIVIAFLHHGITSGYIYFRGDRYDWHDAREPPPLPAPKPPDVNTLDADKLDTGKLSQDWWERVRRWHEHPN